MLGSVEATFYIFLTDAYILLPTAIECYLLQTSNHLQQTLFVADFFFL